MSALQTRMLPSTKSRTFHTVFYKINILTCENIKKNMVFFLGKNLQDDSVEICVRVDSVEIVFCLWFCSMNMFTIFTSFASPIQSPKVSAFDFVAWMHLHVLQAPSKVPNACLWFCSMSSFTRFHKFQGNYPLQNQGHSLLPSLTTT